METNYNIQGEVKLIFLKDSREIKDPVVIKQITDKIELGSLFISLNERKVFVFDGQVFKKVYSLKIEETIEFNLIECQ